MFGARTDNSQKEDAHHWKYIEFARSDLLAKTLFFTVMKSYD